MEAVSKFDNEDTNVFRHRDNHLANSLSLCTIAVFNLVELSHAVYQHGNFSTELRSTLFQRVVGVFHCVMQQGSNDCLGANT